MLGDDLAVALPVLRAHAESRMHDTVRIERGSGAPVTDPDTGEVTYPRTTVYEGKARIQTYEAQEHKQDVGTATITTTRYALHVPVGSYAPSLDDVATVTAAANDPHLVGRRFDVVALLHKTAATAYRLGIEDRTEA